MMNGRFKIEFNDKTTEVHFVGPEFQDAALCGQDLAGDGSDGNSLVSLGGGYSEAQPTEDLVVCPFCIRVVKFCRGIKDNEFSTPTL